MEVLVPIDGSSSTSETVEYAVSEYPDASITVLHVLTPNAAYGVSGMYTDSSVVRSQQENVDTVFETASDIADAHGRSVTTKTAVGSPARAIVTFADETDADRIVIGSCGRSGLSRLLLGNVTEGVVRGAAVPVTVVN